MVNNNIDTSDGITNGTLGMLVDVKKNSKNEVHFLVIDASPKEGQKLSDYLWEQTAEYQQQALNSNYIYTG